MPQGRGLRKGPDAAVNQGESYALRQTLRKVDDTLRFVVPPKGVIPAFLTALEITDNFDSTGLGRYVYEGWAICNGNNGTPSLNGRFPRFATAAAAGTGGSDSSAHTHAIDHNHGAFTSAAESGHTHAIDHDHGAFTSAAESGHTHAIDHDHGSFTSGSESSHTHGAADTGNGTLHARIDMDATSDTLYIDRNSTNWTADAEASFAAIGGSVIASTAAKTAGARVQGETATGSAHSHSVDVPALTGTSGSSSGHTHSVDVPSLAGASGASSGHTHSIDVPSIVATSGAASATENRPAYYELVPLMRVL